MAYGAARSPAEIPAYLADIRGGRPAPPELLAQVTERYAAIGGSPLFAITDAQAAALSKALAARGLPARVAVGMRHAEPTIAAAAAALAKEGIKAVVGLPLTPFQSRLSVGAYYKKLEEAAAGLAVRRVGDWHAHPRLVAAYAARTFEALARVPEALRGRTELLLTAHSLPSRILADGDPYPLQLEETAGLVAQACGFASWRFAYQSRGAGAEPWLGPDAGAVLEESAAAGAKAVVLCPVGFVSEHMETLYDIDVLYKGKAAALGLAFERAGALNDHPDFIAALADTAASGLP
ncbi:MAG: ferrochelatase [Elusimicrobia bacterium]|nr:ferrochelatase [Elusimicrobiota bacterium]